MSTDDSTTGRLARLRATKYAQVLGVRQYRLLFWAMLTSSLGDWIGVIAIFTLTEDILGPTQAGAFAVSIVMIARVVPSVFLGPVAGVFVDRWDRKRTMIGTDIVRGLVMALMAWSGTLVDLIVATFVLELMSALFIPAKDSTIPNVVPEEQLVEANQLSLIATYATLPLGGVFFALLASLSVFFDGVTIVQERPETLAIWVNAVSFGVSALFIAALDLPRSSRRRTVTSTGRDSAWEELKEGIRFISTQPLIRSLTGGIIAAAFAAGIVIAIGHLLARVLSPDYFEQAYGTLVAALGTGMVIGLAASAPLSGRIDLERVFPPAIGTAGAGLILTALAPNMWLAVVPIVLMGFGAGLAFVTGYTLIQTSTSNELRGRTIAAVNSGIRAALFLTLVYAPALVAIIGPEAQGLIEGQQVALGGWEIVDGYRLGGVRIALISGGIAAIIGAMISGSAVYEALQLGSKEAVPQPKRMERGVFLAFEGGEGSGKSTQVGLLAHELRRQGFTVLTTREPGGTPLGEALRDLLLLGDSPIDPHAEALMYAAARAQHVDEVIDPALRSGTIVLCDRFVDSSIVYQGAVRGLGVDEVREINEWATNTLRPDLTFVLDVPASVGLERAREESALDRIESEGLAFHTSVNAGFRDLARRDPARYVILDGTAAATDLHEQIAEVLRGRIAGFRSDAPEAQSGDSAGVPRDGEVNVAVT